MTLIQEVLSWLPFKAYRQIYAGFMVPVTGQNGEKVKKERPLAISDYLGWLIDDIKPSTITIGGRFTGFTLHEERDIGKFTAVEPIVKIGSNFGEHYAPGYTDPVKKPKTSKRGRKPKPKKPKTRIQGSGKYFNSQITFVVRSPSNPLKFYKFKEFRNAKWQVPGVLEAGQDDIEGPIETLRAYFEKVFNTTVHVRDRVVQMRNCKTIISDSELTINTQALGKVIAGEKEGDNPMRISTVEYMSAQNSSKIVVKFSRPTKDKDKKKTTLKILKQKINIEGAVDREDVEDIRFWLNGLLLDNYKTVINDPTAPQDASDSSATDRDSSESDSEDERPVTVYHPYDF